MAYVQQSSCQLAYLSHMFLINNCVICICVPLSVGGNGCINDTSQVVGFHMHGIYKETATGVNAVLLSTSS